MYDELVKAIRQNTCHFDACGMCPKGNALCVDRMALQAADAIEKLATNYDAATDIMKHQTEYIEELSKPRWIPVTERLPNGEAERYLVAAPLMALGLRVSICYYADNLEEVDEYDFKDEKRGGFYGYDDEYGYYEKSGVQYWMPLPEPPKEE